MTWKMTPDMENNLNKKRVQHLENPAKIKNTRRKAASEPTRLTEVELELMHVLWKLDDDHASTGDGGCTIREVMEHLDRELAYTTVSTVLRILEKKKVLSLQYPYERPYVYIPLLSEEEFKQSSLDRFVSNVFAGKSTDLVNYLIESDSVSAAEIAQLQELIDSKSQG